MTCGTTNQTRDNITSLGLIPETSCSKKCPNCYEQYKKYGPELPWPDYLKVVEDFIKTLPNLEEVLIDWNGRVYGHCIRQLVDRIPDGLEVIITARPVDAYQIQDISARFVISSNTEKESDAAVGIETILGDKFECHSVMNKGGTSGHRLAGHPRYINIDKFSQDWKTICKGWINEAAKAGPATHIHLAPGTDQIDNCAVTVMNDQPCPAHTQINLYRDGTMRRCPYSPYPQDPDDSTPFKSGCHLDKGGTLAIIRTHQAKDQNEKRVV